MAETQAFKDRLRRVVIRGVADAYKAALESAREIGADMKRRAPTGDDAQRELRDSIRLETEEPRRVTIKAGGQATRTKQHTDYALHQEYGTRKMPAQPFFWPAWRAGRRKARRRINAALKSAIENIQ